MYWIKRLLRLLAKPFPKSVKDKLWQAALRLRYQLHTKIGERPFLLFKFYSLFKLNTEYMVNEDTDLVLDAFPRSGSTFAYYAFHQAQQGALVSLAYHLHVPAHIIRACELNLPTLVIIRHPKDAVSSAVVREPHLSVRAYLKRYQSFYKAIMPYREKFVMAQFHEATDQMDLLIETINKKFQTNFKVFNYAPENIRQVKEQMQLRLEQVGGQANQSYLPNEAKEQAKKRVDFSNNEKLLKACEEIYMAYQNPLGKTV